MCVVLIIFYFYIFITTLIVVRPPTHILPSLNVRDTNTARSCCFKLVASFMSHQFPQTSGAFQNEM